MADNVATSAAAWSLKHDDDSDERGDMMFKDDDDMGMDEEAGSQ